MACFHPLFAIDYGCNSDGKHVLEFIRQPSPRLMEILSDGESHPVYSHQQGKHVFVTKQQVMQLPCGQCIGCRLSRSREWAIRCLMELKYHNSAYFITLTYDNDHLKWAPLPLIIGDSEQYFPTLVKRDFQLFMKRLRKEFEPQKLRFFGCGEYGSKSLRPHYHIIVFGLELDDLKFEQMNKAKVSGCFSSLYSSKRVEKCWTDENGLLKGLIRIGSVTFESCAYVARYTTKKKDKHFLEAIDAEKEFILMSRKPGIARRYFEDHVGEIFDFDEIFLSSGGKAYEAKPPRYFDKLYDVDYHDELQNIKVARRAVAEAVSEAKLAGTSLTHLEYLELSERVKEAQAEKLRRSLE